ncbi:MULTISPECIES: hypothetical protein [Streptomyces]|uniref:hypothetical protein n=1 Tax=Streptomyces TaxID=1883 RepID=UPI00163B659F|nr:MULTISPECIES: hypothetical protein [Streptomyces]MBC2878357.1 hypothetical protein [Streptomyces sp. TYQ1024]UBI40527.1 hypothetical protein K7I03_31430 [Streptomyces mobaraensis]UKW33109.1 hypothetical protein MCU78_31355 [Streptomyces sp. TYQ1024]
MPDLLWNDVRNLFDPDLMGELPYLTVPGTSAEDWQAVFDLVRSSGWEWEFRVGGVPAPLPPAADVLSRPPDADSADLHVQPVPGVTVIFWLMSADEIDFDVDLRELQGQWGVDTLCAFLRTLGRRLGKPVGMSGGGDYANPVLGYDPAADRVRVLETSPSGD